MDRVELAFRKFDLNHDGFLSRDEFDMVSVERNERNAIKMVVSVMYKCTLRYRINVQARLLISTYFSRLHGLIRYLHAYLYGSSGQKAMGIK